ncbi:response regulator transcription factor [Chitinilyticum piscinae]|uniref:Response regulator transcription factor n=1 Tax=Chitinilyticum piscinae TaxID=2866724 RepID=A0A8J7G1M8_9NEIS|nr:response regulator [Chitinilyticum piscinae]MBE9610325.1 response regulator transcription factor [Chitinilyticum piscinae]
MNQRILIVDDVAATAARLAESLAGLGEVVVASKATDALQRLDAAAYSVVMLSAGLAGTDCFALCRAIRKAHSQTRILFVDGVNGQTSGQARMDAYMAGADDFLESAAHLEEVQRKVELLLYVLDNAERLQHSLEEANSVAMLAITNTSELGGVIDFIKRAMSCEDIETLLKALLSALSGRFSLKGSAQIRLGCEQKTLNTDGRSSPLEAEMLASQAQDARRIFQYGHRLIINYPAVTLLVKELPDDDEYVGRLRDHLAIMAEAADHRVHGIQVEAQNRQKSIMIQQSLRHIRDVIGMLEQNYKQQQSSTLQLFDQMRFNLDPLLTSLGLTDHQEIGILRLIEGTAEDASALYEAGLMLDQHFDGILAELSTLVASEVPAEKPQAMTEDDSILLF